VSRTLAGALVAAVLVWQAVDAIQARLPLSLAWAVLDELGHASVALVVLIWTRPRWGWRPLVAGMLAATLIDVDHVVAARSLVPAEWMSLHARPLAHSILGVLVIANLGAAFGGWRFGYTAAAGAATHIARDAVAVPGVPLLVPMDGDWRVVVPGWTLPAVIFGLACLSAACTRWAPGWLGGSPYRDPLRRSVPAPPPYASQGRAQPD
jgi:membrane-bound metal-dependent hydrolase YbcI (DUF457 family)